MTAQVVAVDWSGDATVAGQRRHIWTASVRDGALVRLENGMTRHEVISSLAADAGGNRELVVGLDFSFSLPAWFLESRGLAGAEQLWDLAESDGERWLTECRPPFWGRPGRRKPRLPGYFRKTEQACPAVAGISPKSTFQVGGAGAVGTGSIRGMPHLARLRKAGFSIWPFDRPVPPVVLEVYPRALTGPVVKSDPAARAATLDRFPMPAEFRRRAAASDDAFDAAVSALVMAARLDVSDLPWPPDPVRRLEGSMWPVAY